MRLESLLLITSPDQSVKNSMDMNDADFLTYPAHSEESSDERCVSFLLLYSQGLIPYFRFRGNRAKHLGRVAAEYTQLLYHVRKAGAEKCAFVDEVQWVRKLFLSVKWGIFMPIN